VRQTCAVCGRSQYHDAKPAACGVLIDGAGRVLLGRRARDPGAGLWDVLGGFMEPGETPEGALVRELREETGLECVVGRYLGGFPDVYGPDGDPTLNLAFECRFSQGEPRAADDVAELVWFAPLELPPPDAFAFPNSVAILDAWTATQTS
jgi:ADP-ribose pyrophosphatase YjhB (NUDIX family)